MKLHASAGLSLKGRQLLVSGVEGEGQTVQAVSESLGISPKTAAKWLARCRAEGEFGLMNRSSAPNRVANRTDERTIEVIAALRRLRFTGPEIAETLDRPLSTVSGILTRIGMGRLGRLGLEPAERYAHSIAGELIHIDVNKLGVINGAGHRVSGNRASQNANRRASRRGGPKGWEYVHVAIDDAARLAYAGVLADERPRLRSRSSTRGPVLRKPRHDRLRAADRQRLGLPRHDPRDRLPRSGHPPPTHPAAPTADQRLSRTLHLHHARRLGLRRDLRHQTTTHRSP